MADRRLLVVAVALTAMASSAYAGNKPDEVVFDFESNGKKLEGIVARRVAEEDDAKKMDLKLKSGSTPRIDILNNENEFYQLTSFSLAADGAIFNGYATGKNIPTTRQNCAGLTFARLIGGPFVLETDRGLQILEAFGTKIEERDSKAGDVIFWRDDTGKLVQHFALVQGWKQLPTRAAVAAQPVMISKDNIERIYIGYVGDFPAERKNCAAGRTYYRLDWDNIKATRRPATAGVKPTKFYAQYYDKTERIVSGGHRYKSPAEAQPHLEILQQIADGVTLKPLKDGTYAAYGKAWVLIDANGSTNRDDARLQLHVELRKKDGYQVQITDTPNWAMYTIDMGRKIEPTRLKRFLPAK